MQQRAIVHWSMRVEFVFCVERLPNGDSSESVIWDLSITLTHK
jgi:hypothetical protein